MSRNLRIWNRTLLTHLIHLALAAGRIHYTWTQS